MLTKGLKKETIDEHMRFTGGQVEQNKLKTALSIHVVSRSKMMRKVLGKRTCQLVAKHLLIGP